MPVPMTSDDRLSVGQVADRAGMAPSAVRFYADQGLIPAERAASGHRRFARSVLRRVAFIKTSQSLGYSLDEIRVQLDELPPQHGPDDEDWVRLAEGFSVDLDQRIRALQALRDRLTECIGCGCLSLARCQLYNPNDTASARGPGPRRLLEATGEPAEPHADA